MDEMSIQKALIYAYECIFQKKAPDIDKHLLSLSLQNDVVDYLYWIERINQEFGIRIEQILEKSDYSIMTIRNIAKAIQKELNENYCDTT